DHTHAEEFEQEFGDAAASGDERTRLTLCRGRKRSTASQETEQFADHRTDRSPESAPPDRPQRHRHDQKDRRRIEGSVFGDPALRTEPAIDELYGRDREK